MARTCLRHWIREMPGQEKIGRGTWIDKLAHELLRREESLGRDLGEIRVESGLGASGIPHIGSLGDAVRAYGVKLALEDMGYRSVLIAYSDDLDGLRKIPDGFPDSLEEHIAKPVSLIPDPFGCHDSYGMHMSSILLDGLDRVGVKYEFRRAVDTYRDGLLADQIHAILQNAAAIGQRISEMVGQEKYRRYLPYFPVCSGCDRLYTAESTGYLADKRAVAYACRDAQIGGRVVKGCGHRGEADVARDLGKLAWKVEFAARWAAFDVRFEAYGKDIMDSVRVNDWVADEVLGFPHPHHVKYEMFLDKGGKKISKSLGNVLTAQRWLEFGSPESILLLLYKRITGARELGLADIPGLMDEYNELEDVYFGKTGVGNAAKLAKMRGLYEYANLLDPPGRPGPHVSYRLLVELCKIFREGRAELVAKKLVEYGVIRERTGELDGLVGLAGNFADEFGVRERADLDLEPGVRGALRMLAEALEAGGAPEEIQDSIYRIAKGSGIPTGEFFRTLYQIILGTTRGPKIGPLISDMGAGRVAKTISEYA